jgi:hypothetical protein
MSGTKISHEDPEGHEGLLRIILHEVRELRVLRGKN